MRSSSLLERERSSARTVRRSSLVGRSPRAASTASRDCSQMATRAARPCAFASSARRRAAAPRAGPHATMAPPSSVLSGLSARAMSRACTDPDPPHRTQWLRGDDHTRSSGVVRGMDSVHRVHRASILNSTSGPASGASVARPRPIRHASSSASMNRPRTPGRTAIRSTTRSPAKGTAASSRLTNLSAIRTRVQPSVSTSVYLC